MMTIAERKRLDELELLSDIGQLTLDQDDEREKLREQERQQALEVSRAVAAAQKHGGVDICAVLAMACATTTPVDCRSDARKAIEAIE